jgi:DNA polymerase-3 subunit alpha
VRGVQPLNLLAKRSRCRLTIEVGGVSAIDALGAILRPARGERGEVMAWLRLGDGKRAQVSLGRDFAIDGELRDKVGRVRGISGVKLTAVDGPQLALVS